MFDVERMLGNHHQEPPGVSIQICMCVWLHSGPVDQPPQPNRPAGKTYISSNPFAGSPLHRSPLGQNAGNNDTCRVGLLQASDSRREVLSSQARHQQHAQVCGIRPHQQISRNCSAEQQLGRPGSPAGPVIGSPSTWLKLLSLPLLLSLLLLLQGCAPCWPGRSGRPAQGSPGKGLQGSTRQVRQLALLPWSAPTQLSAVCATRLRVQEGGPQGEAEGGCRPDQVLWPGPAGV